MADTPPPSTPQRAWIFLPPILRPFAFLLSAAIMLLFAWDRWEKVHAEKKPEQLTAPITADVIATIPQDSEPAKARPALNLKQATAPGKPVEFNEVAPPKSGLTAKTEEERSAINERLYQNLEQEKKKMGIARVIEKSDDADSPLTAPATPAPKLLVLKSAEALRAAWTAAGLDGEPPKIRFPKKMALFLVCSSRCGIVSAQERKNTILVRFAQDGHPPAARVRAVSSTSKPAILKPAP